MHAFIYYIIWDAIMMTRSLYALYISMKQLFSVEDQSHTFLILVISFEKKSEYFVYFQYANIANRKAAKWNSFKMIYYLKYMA